MYMDVLILETICPQLSVPGMRLGSYPYAGSSSGIEPRKGAQRDNGIVVVIHSTNV